MKALLTVLALFAAVTVHSQTAPLQDSIDSQIHHRLTIQPDKNLITITPVKANEIRHYNLVYSGIAVELAKTRNPLQMINPLAPAEYGSGEDNVTQDPITSRTYGLKFLSIRF